MTKVSRTAAVRGRRTRATRGSAGERSGPRALSRDTISAAALALIDAHGLAEFSTRQLGRALGCEAMAIYWYYPSKDDLLDAVVDRLMATIGAASADRPDDWVAALRGIAHGYREIARAHPRAFPLLATRRFASASTYQFLDDLFEGARKQGISDRVAARYYRVVSAYCNGFAMNELAARRDAKDAAAAALQRRFTRVAAVLAWLEPRHADDVFAFGLELLLDALIREAKHGRPRA